MEGEARGANQTRAWAVRRTVTDAHTPDAAKVTVVGLLHRLRVVESVVVIGRHGNTRGLDFSNRIVAPLRRVAALVLGGGFVQRYLHDLPDATQYK